MLIFAAITLYRSIIQSVKCCDYSMAVCPVNNECILMEKLASKMIYNVSSSSTEHCSLTAICMHGVTWSVSYGEIYLYQMFSDIGVADSLCNFVRLHKDQGEFADEFCTVTLFLIRNKSIFGTCFDPCEVNSSKILITLTSKRHNFACFHIFSTTKYFEGQSGRWAKEER